MKAFIQRVSVHTAIRSQEDLASELYEDSFLGVGFVVLLGWLKSDEEREDLLEAEKWIVSKVQGLRTFPDDEGKMNLNLETYLSKSNLEGGILWVPQFTLAASLESGFRPSFVDAMDPQLARMRFQMLKKNIESKPKPYKQMFGRFAANMELSFTNWGPVSFMLER